MKFIFWKIGLTSVFVCGLAMAQNEGTLQQLETPPTLDETAQPAPPVETKAQTPTPPATAAPAPSLKDLNPNAPKVERPKKPGEENLLSFEEEVIEGEKKRPELFLDIKAGDGNLGSGLYKRSNFDDFFAVDRIRRPHFVKAK